MDMDESLDIEIFDEEKSREIVIDFIQNKTGCIAEDILRGQNRIGRKKLFRILSDLKNENVIIEGEKSKPNARNKHLLVNGANPLTVTLNELEKFEKIYCLILEKTVDVCNKKQIDAISALEQDLEEPSYLDLLSSMDSMWLSLNIFVEFFKLYLIRLIIVWSKVIQNKDVMSKLYSMIFAKFAQIQARSYQIMTSRISEEIISGTVRSSCTTMQRSISQQLKEHTQILKKHGMEKEAKELSDFLDGINTSEGIREYFYAENKPYRWDLKYKDDELKALAEDIDRHQDYIDDAYYDDYRSSLEG